MTLGSRIRSWFRATVGRSRVEQRRARRNQLSDGLGIEIEFRLLHGHQFPAALREIATW